MNVDQILTIAILLARAAERYTQGSSLAATLADRMHREGRRLPNEEEQAQIDEITALAKAAEDAAIARAEAEGR